MKDAASPPASTFDALPRPGLTLNAMALGSLVIGLTAGAAGAAGVLWIKGIL